MSNGVKFPVRLLVHFRAGPAGKPLVQVTDGRQASGAGFVGAGTRVIHMPPNRHFPLRDDDGNPTGETVTAAHVLQVLAAISE